MIKFHRFWVGLFCLLALIPFSAAQTFKDGEAIGWPRTVIANGIKAEIYQPQLDSWNEVRLQVHAAMAVTFPGAKEPTYGVLAMDATTQIDRSTRSVRLDHINSLTAKLPSSPEQEAGFIASMKDSLVRGVGVISLDRLEAALAVSQAEHRGEAQPVKNDPPLIIFSQQPALLIYTDGEPHWQAVLGTSLQRVLNTRVLLLRDSSQHYYLHFMDGYLTASSLNGPWTVAKSAPASAASAEKQALAGKQTDLLVGQADKEGGPLPSLKKLSAEQVPQVIIEGRAAELVVFDGEPNYLPVDGTNLLYVKNTSANVFKNMIDQQSYVLLSGRWFRANSLNGPWAYVAPKDLPPDFAKIPDSSAKENVKASVPGTPQAREAAIANDIPQTAKVDRQTTKFVAAYDGAPQLRAIDGTPLEYVFNTADPVIRVDERSWYALHNAIWFAASSVNGPWVVADSVPAIIYSIPVSSPIHYVTYVKIYEASPTVVVVGYTPGYYGSIITSDGVVVYGTGYVYTPWIGTYWYGPPVSYGIGVSMAWTPWGGWAFGFGFGWAMGYASFGWYYPPAPWWGPYWWGAGSYANAYGGVTAWGPNGWAGTTGNIYQRWGNVQTVSRGFAGYNAFTGNQFAGRYGTAYNSVTGAMAVGRQGAVQNVYTGNYAAGGRVAGYNPTTGVAAAGGRVTVGNPDTGNTVTANHVNAYNSRTGNSINAGGIHNNQGEGIGHINNSVYATKDGQVYRYDPNNPDHWQPMVKGQNQSSGQINHPQAGQEAGEQDRAQNLQKRQQNMPDRQQLEQDRSSRELGSRRADSFRDNGAQFSKSSDGFGRRGLLGGGSGRFFHR